MALAPISLKAFALRRARDLLADAPDLRAALGDLPDDVIRELLRVDRPLALLAEVELRYAYQSEGYVEGYVAEVGHSAWFALYRDRGLSRAHYRERTADAQAVTSAWSRVRLFLGPDEVDPTDPQFTVCCELRPGSAVPELATAAVSHEPGGHGACGAGSLAIQVDMYLCIRPWWLWEADDRGGQPYGAIRPAGAPISLPGEPYAWPPRSPAQERLAAAQAERWGPGAEATARSWVERAPPS